MSLPHLSDHVCTVCAEPHQVDEKIQLHLHAAIDEVDVDGFAKILQRSELIALRVTDERTEGLERDLECAHRAKFASLNDDHLGSTKALKGLRQTGLRGFQFDLVVLAILPVQHDLAFPRVVDLLILKF